MAAYHTRPYVAFPKRLNQSTPKKRSIPSSRFAVDDTSTQPFKGELAFAEFAERRRDTAKDTGIMGDATVANAEKGARIFALACDRLEKLLREYRDLPVRHYREFGSHCT